MEKKAAAQAAEWLAAAWNGQAHDALASVCFSFQAAHSHAR